MKKISTAVARQTKNFRDHKLTIGLDLGDRSSWYCVLDEGESRKKDDRLDARRLYTQNRRVIRSKVKIKVEQSNTRGPLHHYAGQDPYDTKRPRSS